MVKFQFVEDSTPIKLIPPSPAIIDIFENEDIDFNKIANSSEFKRFVYMLRTGKTHRGTKEDLDQKLKDTQEVIDVVKEIGRGTTLDKQLVIAELKEALAKRKAKIEQ